MMNDDLQLTRFALPSEVVGRFRSEDAGVKACTFVRRDGSDTTRVADARVTMPTLTGQAAGETAGCD